MASDELKSSRSFRITSAKPCALFRIVASSSLQPTLGLVVVGGEWFSSKAMVRCFVYRLVVDVAERMPCVPVSSPTMDNLPMSCQVRRIEEEDESPQMTSPHEHQARESKPGGLEAHFSFSPVLASTQPSRPIPADAAQPTLNNPFLGIWGTTLRLFLLKSCSVICQSL